MTSYSFKKYSAALRKGVPSFSSPARYFPRRPRYQSRATSFARERLSSFVENLCCLPPNVQAILAEVTNTPWGERHAYVIPGGRGRFEKALHVSPFLAMDHTYVCQSALPARELSVRIENTRQGARVFQAVLTLRRRELSPASVRRMTARYPLAAARVLGLIYGHAIALRLAGTGTFPHRPRVSAGA